MQRILSVYDWQKLEERQQVVIKSDVEDQRLVRWRVNAPSPVALYVEVAGLVDPVFVARVEGFDVIEFNIEGDYALFPVGGEVWVHTMDGARADVEPVEPDSFTSIVERKAQNQEMLLMERKMQENIERRMFDIANAMAATLAAKDAEIEAARNAAAAASAPASQPDAGQVSPDAPAQPVAGGAGGESNAAN